MAARTAALTSVLLATARVNNLELVAGLILIIGGFIKNPFGNLMTRAAAFVIVIIMNLIVMVNVEAELL